MRSSNGQESVGTRRTCRVGIGILGVFLSLGYMGAAASTASAAPRVLHAHIRGSGPRRDNLRASQRLQRSKHRTIHPTGAIRSSTTRVPARTKIGEASLPNSVNLSAWTVPVGNQESTESCVTWAIDYGLLGWYSNYDHLAVRSQVIHAPVRRTAEAVADLEVWDAVAFLCCRAVRGVGPV